MDGGLCVRLYFSRRNYQGVWLEPKALRYTQKPFRTGVVQTSIGRRLDTPIFVTP